MAQGLMAYVVQNQTDLVAKWLSIGFIHGVMNTDNTAISGETIDYGPCAFMEVYDPDHVLSSIDSMGRYAYNQQATCLKVEPGTLAYGLDGCRS